MLQAFFLEENAASQQPPDDIKQEDSGMEPLVAVTDDYIDLSSPARVSEEVPPMQQAMSMSLAVVDAALNRLGTDDLQDCSSPAMSRNCV